MDAFTRKLLESTKARQESLNQKMIATPQPLPRKRRSPLNDNLDTMELEIKDINTDYKKQRPSDEFEFLGADGDQDPEAKENTQTASGCMQPEEMSSNKSEKMPETSPTKSRFKRLAALAADINSWEDEALTSRSSKSTTSTSTTPSTANSASSAKTFRFPSTPGSSSSSRASTSKTASTPSSGSSCGRSTTNKQQPSPIKTPCKVTQVDKSPVKASKEKNIAWDQAVMSTLQAQGFVQSPSKARLLYSYKEEEMRALRKAKSVNRSASSSDEDESPKPVESSPPKIQQQRSVKEMAKKFAGPPKPKGPDPAELPLSARVALFEKEAAASSAAASATKTLFSKAPSSSKLAPVQPPLPKPTPVNTAKPMSSVAKSPTRNIAALAKAATPKVTSPAKGTPQTVAMQRELFERAKNDWRDNDIAHKVKAERDNEMKALLQRWNHRDETSNGTPTNTEVTPSTKPKTISPKKSPKKPRSPKEKALMPPPPPPPLPSSSGQVNKSPGQPQRLYPELPPLETEESEEEYSEESEDVDSAVENLDALLDDAFGEQSEDGDSEDSDEDPVDNRADITDYESSILQEAIRKVPSLSKKTPPAKEAQVINMPPPKPPHLPPQRLSYSEPVAIDPELLHTVSFYRREKDKIKVTPHRTVVRREITSPPSPQRDITAKQKEIQSTIKFLQEEAGRQQAIASQASQALFVCHTKPEFYGSTEQVEGERLLLIASHKRQSCLNEILRLKTETALDDSEGTGALASSGTLSISDIKLPLKREFLVQITESKSDAVHCFIILVKHRGKVVATQMLSTIDGVSGGNLSFNHLIKIDDLKHDFNVLLEVYALQVNRSNHGQDRKALKKEKSRIALTPKKKKHDAKSPAVPSPAGHSGLKTSSFGMVGFALINIKTLHRKSWNLEKVPYVSPLEGNIHMKISCDTDFNIQLRNFLTMFEDVSGFGAWHRRWFVLSSRYISYWTYPEDENKKEPLGRIDLRECVTPKVALAPRDICARPHTFLMNTVRPSKQGDRDSLVVQNYNAFTSTKIMLSADTKEERILWCNSLNQVVENLRTWDPEALRPMPTPFPDTEC